MSQLIVVGQATPVSSPSSGQIAMFGSSSQKKMNYKDDAGKIYMLNLDNAKLSAQTSTFASDTYLTGSPITIPSAGLWQAGMVYQCWFDMVKTAAGTGAFTVNVRIGTAGTTSDSSRCSLAFAVGTAAGDTGLFYVQATFRSVGSGTAAVVQGFITCRHHLAATGLITTGASGFGLINATGSGFDSTTGTIIGLSVNGGTSFSGTCTQTYARLSC